MDIIVLGTGCPKCTKLEQRTREATSELGIEARIEKEQDIQKIMAYGVMATPALVKDGEVVLSGKLPSVKELKHILGN